MYTMHAMVVPYSLALFKLTKTKTKMHFSVA